MASKSRTQFNLIISDAVFLAGITLTGYVVAYASHFSYLSYFGLPIYFINISIKEILASILVVSSYTFFSFFLLEYTFFFFTSKKNPGFEKVALVIFLLGFISVPFLLFCWNSNHPLRSWIEIGLLISFLVAGGYSLNLDIEKNAETLMSELEDRSFFFRVEKIIGTSPLITVLLTCLLLAYSFLFGSWIAKNQETYLVTKNASIPYFVVSDYQDGFVALNYSTTTDNKRVFGNQVRIFTAESLQENEFELAQIGPLSPDGHANYSSFLSFMIRN
ncbi:MAG: hypothetical protein ACM3TU_00475 [Bacillota bacterium]